MYRVLVEINSNNNLVFTAVYDTQKQKDLCDRFVLELKPKSGVSIIKKNNNK
jgi:hypothetical protein